MVDRIIIIILSLVIVFILRSRIAAFVKTTIAKCVPLRYFRGSMTRVRKETPNSAQNDSRFIPVLSAENLDRINHAIKVTFTGDLILLKDMVENGYDSTEERYSFDSMFEFVKDYYQDSDFNIGVFEGPVAGVEKGFSSSCFDDGIPIYLNFPIEYALAVKKAGLNLVSLANNHMLDKGVDGLYHTLDALDGIGLSHVGAYRNEQEKNKVPVINIRGKRIAVLSYTYGSNHFKTDFFFQSDNKHLTRIIVSPKNDHIMECLESVKKDFAEAKRLCPDLIVVIPHMGKQFRHHPDDFQKYWCKVFVENGADLVLSDHPHAVQPIEWVTNAGKYVLVVHCPGNFINSYTKKDGDASMIVECYIDSTTGNPFAAACIPIYAYSKLGRSKVENYKGIPIYKLVKDEQVCPELSRYEYERIKEVHKLITRTALGVEVDIDDLKERYYSFAEVGYVRSR